MFLRNFNDVWHIAPVFEISLVSYIQNDIHPWKIYKILPLKWFHNIDGFPSFIKNISQTVQIDQLHSLFSSWSIAGWIPSEEATTKVNAIQFW